MWQEELQAPLLTGMAFQSPVTRAQAEEEDTMKLFINPRSPTGGYSRGYKEGCTLGWVNLYQKFEIEKYTVCGKLILPKKWKGIFFWQNWLANLHGFLNICKLPVSNTFKDMQSKI